jgi:hypothetical protein
MKFPTISSRSANLTIAACLVCFAGLIILAYAMPTTPPTQVVPAAVAPLPQKSRETPQEPQESPKAPQGNLSASDSPILAPAAPVLPLPPPDVIEVPVEIEVPAKVEIVPAQQYPNNRCSPRRRWFRW